jgi:hypothetical protein
VTGHWPSVALVGGYSFVLGELLLDFSSLLT